ncbi:MAG: helix-turn-helix transcriptional regulator [Flavobacteriaceae bacterium]|nr:helix-turn-helix transcriptional regulator [Flavobacteriaceae bacterium]
MKVQLETIAPNTQSPFRLLHLPRLNHLFYWHFHPEFELVYIEGASATRHVGHSISQFEGSDLVFIGSNIPHLNFDYGVKSEYIKDVLHIKPSFSTDVLEKAEELTAIRTLFEDSRRGIVFTGATKSEVGKRMMALHRLDPFSFYMESMAILQLLAKSSDRFYLHEEPFVNRYRKKEQERLRKIYAHIDEHYGRKIEIQEIAELCHLSKEAFCRYFKKSTGNTFTTFLNQYRVSHAQRQLLMGKNVAETCFSCGFESLSYFNRVFKKVVGENPSTFKRQRRRS